MLAAASLGKRAGKEALRPRERGAGRRLRCRAVQPALCEERGIARLAPEIAWEPRCALDGGADGLDGFRAVAGGAARLLAINGVAAFEIGDGQARAVGDLMRAAGFGAVVKHRDLSGAVRCLSARRGSRQPI